MNLRTLIDLKIDSVLRSPHLFQKVLMLFASFVYLLLAVSMLFMLSLKMRMLVEEIGLSCNNSLSLFFTVAFLLVGLDFFLRTVLQKNRFSFARFNYLPNTSKVLKQYYYIKELTNIVLFYIPFLLVFHVISSIVPEYGVVVAMGCIVFAYSLALFNAQMVSFLKQKGISKFILIISSFLICAGIYGLLYFSLIPFSPILLLIVSILCIVFSLIVLPANYQAVCYSLDQEKKNNDLFFSNVGFGKNRIQLYAILFLKMEIRSPLLRKQLLVMTALSFIYIFMIKPINNPAAGTFMFEVIWPLFIFLFVPLSVSQLTLRAEGSFFDQLYMSPDIQNLLKARYIVGIGYSVVMLFFYCGIYFIRFDQMPSWNMFIPAWLLGIGPFLLLSFLSIFITGPKIDLFDTSWTNSSQNSNKIQSLFVMILITLILSLCYVLFEYTSHQLALWIMAIAGGVCVLFSFKYLDFIFKLYHQRRHKRMESYRVK